MARAARLDGNHVSLRLGRGMPCGWPLRDFEVDGRAVDDLVGRIGEFDQKLVGPRRKPLDDERFTARIDPMPGRIIDGDVKVPYTGRNIKSGRTEDRQDPQVLGPVSDDDKAHRQLLGKG